jgi:MEMO1 family protein
MGSLDRPKLRHLAVHRLEHEGRVFAALEDPLGVFPDAVLVPIEGFQTVVRHFDGGTSLAQIQARVGLETGKLISTTELEHLVSQLDRAMVLDGPTFSAFQDRFAREAVRPAALAGRSYAGTELALRAQLARFFADAQGAGIPDGQNGRSRSRLRGILSPHIDFHRGGPVYTWAYRELVEQSDADVFVILGVAHQYCTHRFALTTKDFDTPLGLVRTDREYVKRIAARAGSHLFEDELAHRTEHSIEFQAVFLKFLLGGRREFTIVPILVGSFHDLMEQEIDPIQSEEVLRFVEALREAESRSGKKVVYIGGIDLSHVGPEFGDPGPVDAATLERVRGFDHVMLDRAVEHDPKGWFGTAATLGNRWRVCGLAATYTMLHAMGPARGRLLKYHQAVDDERTCCVSFASLAFDEEHEHEPIPGSEVRDRG